MQPQNEINQPQNNQSSSPVRKSMVGAIVGLFIALILIGLSIPGKSGAKPLVIGILGLGCLSSFKLMITATRHSAIFKNFFIRFFLISTSIGLGIFIFVTALVIALIADSSKDPQSFECG